MDGIAWAESAMVAARTRLEIATENLANVSTDGFRRIDGRGFLTALGVTIARRTSADGGVLRHTGRNFDLAILGGGAFRVRDSAGRVSETRAGAFVREADGTLHDVLHVPSGGVVDAHALGLPSTSRVQSGFLEGPAVDAVAEMIDVLSAERSFESAEKAVAAIDATRQKSADAARVK
jgi:flagellar basal body rod protein FlgG